MKKKAIELTFSPYEKTVLSFGRQVFLKTLVLSVKPETLLSKLTAFLENRTAKSLKEPMTVQLYTQSGQNQFLPVDTSRRRVAAVLPKKRFFYKLVTKNRSRKTFCRKTTVEYNYVHKVEKFTSNCSELETLHSLLHSIGKELDTV